MALGLKLVVRLFIGKGDVEDSSVPKLLEGAHPLDSQDHMIFDWRDDEVREVADENGIAPETFSITIIYDQSYEIA